MLGGRGEGGELGDGQRSRAASDFLCGVGGPVGTPLKDTIVKIERNGEKGKIRDAHRRDSKQSSPRRWDIKRLLAHPWTAAQDGVCQPR